MPSNDETPKKLLTATRTDIVRYAGAGGDFNPVHHDEPYAQSLGFPSVFAMGMLTVGVTAAAVVDAVGIGRLARLSARFVAPTWPGDCLVLTQAHTGSEREFTVATGAGEPRLSGSYAVGDDLRPVPPVASGDVASPQDERLRTILATDLGDVILPVERGKVMEFARAVHATHPAYFDVEAARSAGLADLPAPPTFSQVQSHWNGGDAAELPLVLGLDLTKVLHASQAYQYGRPIVAGDFLVGRRSVVAVSTKESSRGGTLTFVTVETTFSDGDGEVVLIEDMSMVERS